LNLELQNLEMAQVWLNDQASQIDFKRIRDVAISAISMLMADTNGGHQIWLARGHIHEAHKTLRPRKSIVWPLTLLLTGCLIKDLRGHKVAKAS
jgi:hypothetical protein